MLKIFFLLCQNHRFAKRYISSFFIIFFSYYIQYITNILILKKSVGICEKESVEFLTEAQALDFIEQLSSDDYLDDPEIVCLPSGPNIVRDEKGVTERNLFNDLFHKIFGGVELFGNFKSTDN